MNSEAVRMTLRITKALADLQRVRILMMLGSGELCVCQIVEVLGLAPSTTSKHLSILGGAGLVDSRKDGRWGYYRLPEGTALRVVRPLLEWLTATLKGDAMMKNDALLLKNIKACDIEVICKRQRKRGM